MKKLTVSFVADVDSSTDAIQSILDDISSNVDNVFEGTVELIESKEIKDELVQIGWILKSVPVYSNIIHEYCYVKKENLAVFGIENLEEWSENSEYFEINLDTFDENNGTFMYLDLSSLTIDVFSLDRKSKLTLSKMEGTLKKHVNG